MAEKTAPTRTIEVTNYIELDGKHWFGNSYPGVDAATAKKLVDSGHARYLDEETKPQDSKPPAS